MGTKNRALGDGVLLEKLPHGVLHVTEREIRQQSCHTHNIKIVKRKRRIHKSKKTKKNKKKIQKRRKTKKKSKKRRKTKKNPKNKKKRRFKIELGIRNPATKWGARTAVASRTC